MKALSYPVIYNGDEILNELKLFVASRNYSAIAVLADENTERFCLPYLNDIISKYTLLKIKSGEENKNISTCTYLWQRLSDSDTDRKSLLINLGGGVICDIGGFVAATYKRGTDFINVPTTLLAMCDAGTGGKTGVNLNELKNQIGIIKNPQAVFIWQGFLDTLPEKHILSGFAEIIKHALICDKEYFYKIKNTSCYKKDISGYIAHSIRIKTSITESDINEWGIRKSLNFGHSTGHALESFFSGKQPANPVYHGEAVAAGIIMESWIAHNKKFITSDELGDIVSLISRWFPKIAFNENDYKKIISYIYKDKKNERQKLLFTLPYGIGKFRIDEAVTEKEITDSLEFYLMV